ncbi:Acyl carrier protein [subsurface metagenome]
MKDNIINLINEVLETAVDENSTQDNSENWDSLNHIRIVMELQDKFEIKIPEKDIDKLLSIKEIIKYVRNRSK